MSYKEYIFALVHSEHKKGWWLDRAAIVIYNNFFLLQQEHEGIISLNKIIVEISKAQRLNTKDLIGGIRIKKGY